MGALKGKVGRVEASLREELGRIELNNGEAVLFAPLEVGSELFLWGTRWLRAQASAAK